MRRVIPLLGLLGVLAGCAGQTPVMHYGQREGGRLFFPAAPETPRFLYLGELTGEDNFKAPEQGAANAAQALFGWLVGLSERIAPRTELQRPQSGVTDDTGRIYVTDVSRQAVFVFDESQGRLDVWDMAEQSVRFVTPVGIALGPDGQVLVADADLGMVARLSREGTPLEGFGKGLLKRPTGLARDPVRGLIYVADARGHDIKVFDDAGRLVEIIGQQGTGDAAFNTPTHLTFAGDRLYVTDTLNARIQVFGRDDALAQKIGQRGLYVGNLVRPKGVAVDDEGNIYVVESLYDNLLVFNREGQFLMAIGGTGKEPGQFFLPAGVWTDKRNRIYVADMFNGRIVMLQYLGE